MAQVKKYFLALVPENQVTLYCSNVSFFPVFSTTADVFFRMSSRFDFQIVHSKKSKTWPLLKATRL